MVASMVPLSHDHERLALSHDGCGTKSKHTQKFKHEVRRQQRGDLSRSVEWRRNLDDVAADECETAEAAHELLRFVTREAADLRGAGTGRKRRIDRVDVEGHVGGAGSHALNLRNRPPDPARLDLIDVDHRNSVLAVEVEIVF